MPIPIFATPVGTFTTSTGATALAPPLPVGFAAGDLFFWMTASKNNAAHTYPAGWGTLQTNSGAAWTVSVAAKMAVSGEVAAAVSWTGSAACASQVWRYTGVDATTPFGVLGTVSTGTGSPHISSSITTTRANSLVIVVDAAASNTALGALTGWTHDLSNGTGGGVGIHFDEQSKGIVAVNTASGAVGPTGSAAAWVEQQLEILSPVVVVPLRIFPNMPMLGM